MATKRLYVKEDITDWRDEMLRAEVDVTTIDKAIQEQMAGRHIAQIGKFGIVAHAAKMVGEDEQYLPGNKLLLMVGAANEIRRLMASRKRTVELENGQSVTVRETVAPVYEFSPDDDAQEFDALADEPEAEPFKQDVAWCDVQSQKAMDRATDYLLQRVPGYAIGRLNIIAVNGGDVRKAADALISKIDEAVEKLTAKK